MQLDFVAIDPDTRDGNCPTVWVERDAGELVFQGWKATYTAGPLSAGESVVRLPARMTEGVRRACDIAEQCERAPLADTALATAVRVDPRTGDLVVRGWDAPADMIALCLETGGIPETEMVVRLPGWTVGAVRRACDIADGLVAGTA